jgi:hypothetical protein
MREPSQIHDPRESSDGSVPDEWDQELADYRVQCLIQIVVAAILLAALVGLVLSMTRS